MCEPYGISLRFCTSDADCAAGQHCAARAEFARAEKTGGGA